jgi:hypothetical protein
VVGGISLIRVNERRDLENRKPLNRDQKVDLRRAYVGFPSAREGLPSPFSPRCNFSLRWRWHWHALIMQASGGLDYMIMRRFERSWQRQAIPRLHCSFLGPPAGAWIISNEQQKDHPHEEQLQERSENDLAHMIVITAGVIPRGPFPQIILERSLSNQPVLCLWVFLSLPPDKKMWESLEMSTGPRLTHAGPTHRS